MPPPTESSLLVDLQASDDGKRLHSLFSDYLRPISSIANSKKTSKKPDQTTVRSLAQQFLSFISKSSQIIYSRLHVQNLSQQQQASLSPLFDTYRLCITCIESVSSQLSGGPHRIQIERLRLVYCLHAWGRYEEGESEALRVLERLRGEADSEGKFVPSINADNGDSKFGSMVLEAVATIVKSVALGQSKDCRKYERVLALLEQVRPWFRVVEVVPFEQAHTVLVTYLGRCCRFLVEAINYFAEDLVRRFCVECLAEYSRSTMKDQVYKFARRLCSSLFSLEGRNSFVPIDLVAFLLASISSKCKVEMDNSAIGFVELADYGANKCRAAGTNFCSTLARQLNEMAADFHQATIPVDLILRLYAMGLDLTECNFRSEHDDFTNSRAAEDDSAVKVLFLERDKLHNLSTLLGSLGNYFKKETCILSDSERKNSVNQMPLQPESEGLCSLTCKDRKAHLVMYHNILKFLCQPLAELVNSGKKRILAETEASSDSKLYVIQDAFYQFCDNFFSLESYTLDAEGENFDDGEVLIPSVIVAGFILSLYTKLKMEKSVHLLKQIIGSGWIRSQGLKYLFVSLYNIGILMYRSKKMTEALKALKLSHRASWSNIQLLYEMFTHKKRGFDNHLSEDAIRDLITDACTRSAFLLEVLHASGNPKVKRIMVDSLEHWSAAENLFRQLPGPMALIKQWVKIQCKVHKNVDVEDSAPILCGMLLSSSKVSKRTIGKLLEQELLAYQEMYHGYPDFCQRMQIKVIDLLMQGGYATEGPLQKARLLIRKGRALRANGIEALKDCIHCLSEAISIMNNFSSETCNPGTAAQNQLAAAYCLRALCTQEADPNSELVYQDICAGLDLWLSIFVPDCCSMDDELKMVSGNSLPVLYNILDLLSVKGCTKLHSKIYQLIIRIFKQNSLQPEKCLANLWECRRLSHALCVSPVNEAFIMNLSEHCGEGSKSIDFWINCLCGSQPGLLGFQQNLMYSFNSLTHSLKNHEQDFQSSVTVNNVKQVVLDLISSDPVPSHSLFLAGYLYYDLSERHISNGRLFEALSYAKEAFHLRNQLFKRKFTFSIEEQVEKYDETSEIGENAEIVRHVAKNLQVHRTVASELWPSDSKSWDLCGYYLSPWIVLQCYLESVLQVGNINEMTGNGSEAETRLLWGRNISSSLSLPLFEVAFSSILGKLYRKRRLWDVAEKELQSARRILVECSSCHCCLKCRLMLEVNLDQQLGDLFRNHFESTITNNSKERLSHAEFLYASALEKLKHSEWKNISCDDEKDETTIITRTIISSEDVAGNADAHHHAKHAVPIDARKSRRTKNVSKSLLKEQYVIPERNSRTTRSRSRSSQNQSVSSTYDAQLHISNHSNGNVVPQFSDTCWENGSLLGTESCMDKVRSEITCICKRTKCWQCLPTEIMKSGLLNNFINMRWEYARRRLLVRVLTGIGKCLGYHGQTQEIHDVLWQSISVLVSRNIFTQTCSSAQGTFLLDLIGREILGDAFAVERAAVLYSIGWITMKNFHSKDTRMVCCNLSNVQLSKIVYWLKLSFVLCREVPVLFQKVSRLLSAVYLLSATTEHLCLPSCKELSESHWASFFHQASLGTHNYQLFPNTCQNFNARCLVDSRDLHVVGSSCLHKETSTSLRLAPESVNDLEQFVMSFYAGLPCIAMICISLLGRAYTSLLQELLLYPSCIHAWMLLSRLNSKNQPVVLLLPLDSSLEEVSDDAAPHDDKARACRELRQLMSSGKKWRCPWGSTVVDDVAPVFKVILEENFITSSAFPIEDNTTRSLWWMNRKKVDHQLGKMLSDLEDSWLGSWRNVLLGDCLDCKSLNTVHKKLVQDLKSKCKMDINESFIKLILGGPKFNIEEACLSQQCLKKGCYIGLLKHQGKENCRSNSIDKVSALASQLIHEAVNQLQLEDTISREPIILVLDSDIQMLPWESIPILRQQEVYRMPSVGSICMILERSWHCQEQVGRNGAAYPLIDPLDAFYVLNPSGDLRNTQAQFENWFRDQNFEGKAGTEPTAEEMATALKSHDLFLYFGHGSGEQYLPRHEIRRLENCAAALLMGCSSGSLKLFGCYIPKGVPLSYIQAGSPLTIANLWAVTDKDIDRFGKAVLDAWLRERLELADCSQCNQMIKEFEGLKIRGRRGNSRKKAANTNSLVESSSSSKNTTTCDHKPKIGSFVGKARQTCTLPFVNGAAPVCYGVPTGIRRKKDL